MIISKLVRISENEIDVEKPGETNKAGDALDVVVRSTEEKKEMNVAERLSNPLLRCEHV